MHLYPCTPSNKSIRLGFHSSNLTCHGKKKILINLSYRVFFRIEHSSVRHPPYHPEEQKYFKLHHYVSHPAHFPKIIKQPLT